MPAATINVAVVGLGFMGATHARAWQEIPRARLAAVVSSDEKKLAGDLSGVGGNLGDGGAVVDFSGVQKYRAVEEALRDPEIDVVDICVPTDQHARSAISALRTGKHVLVEKPLALDEPEAQVVIAEARRNGRTLMVGQVLRFFPGYAALGDILRGSGPVRSAIFRRRCGAPAWSRWLKDPARSGGGIFDLLIHDVDYCISRWGLPESVRASGYEDLARGIDVVHAELRYPGLGPVIITGGWHHPGSYPFSMEFTVTTDQSTVEWSSAAGDFREYMYDGNARTRTLADANPFADELAYFADCVIESRAPERCPPEQSAQAVGLMRKIMESRKRNGETVACRS